MNRFWFAMNALIGPTCIAFGLAYHDAFGIVVGLFNVALAFALWPDVKGW